MKILIAEDDLVSRRMLEVTLIKLGYEVVVTCDGEAALQVLGGADAPKLAILDWMMPGMDGVEVCKKLRSEPTVRPTYIIMLTAKTSKESLVAGLDGGADDFIGKPFDREELRARLQVGRRIVELQGKLAERVLELEQALAQVQQLQGLLPICCYCKKIRDDSNYWQQVEGYIASHTGARFSHGICPDCWTKEVLPQIREGERPPPTMNPSRLDNAKPSL
jgi:sigma-B regulation protein RsbU (phosphoserine phosphatase)